MAASLFWFQTSSNHCLASNLFASDMAESLVQVSCRYQVNFVRVLVPWRFFKLGAELVELHDSPLQAVEEEVDDRGREQREQLGDQQAADDGDAQGLAEFRAYAHADRQRKAAEQSGHGGHHDGPEAQQAGLIDGFNGRQALVALCLQSKVDHHDGVLFDNAYEQDDADEGDDAEVGTGEQEGEDGAHAGRRQRGENGEGMDQALIEDAEDDVDGDQRSEDEIRLVLE